MRESSAAWTTPARPPCPASLPCAPAGVQDIIASIDSETSCVVVQTPDFFGHLHDVMNHTVDRADVARWSRLPVILRIPLAFAVLGIVLDLWPRREES